MRWLPMIDSPGTIALTLAIDFALFFVSITVCGFFVAMIPRSMGGGKLSHRGVAACALALTLVRAALHFRHFL